MKLVQFDEYLSNNVGNGDIVLQHQGIGNYSGEYIHIRSQLFMS